jgi:hypothetical protein
MNLKPILAITAIPLLGLSIFMNTQTPTVETGTNVERQEFTVVETKVAEVETKVEAVDTKIEEVKAVQTEQAKQIEEVKTQVQEVKTVAVQAPTPTVAPEPVVVKNSMLDFKTFLENNQIKFVKSSEKTFHLYEKKLTVVIRDNYFVLGTTNTPLPIINNGSLQEIQDYILAN